MQIAYHRTDEQKASHKTKGDTAETEFIHQISRLGAYAHTTGRIPFDVKSCPRIQLPARYDESEQDYRYPRLVAPDVTFWWPHWPVASMAQVKAKNLCGKVQDGSAFFWLDEEQLYKMNEAAKSGANVVFVVYCPELEAIPGLSALSFVDIRDLREEQIRLPKVISCGKPSFQIPLNVFRPLDDLKDHIANENLPAAKGANGDGGETYPRYAFAA